MKRNIVLGITTLLSVFSAGLVFAKDFQIEKTQYGRRGESAATRTNNDASQNARRTQASRTGISTTSKNREATSTVSAQSKQQHDAAKQIIDNLK